MPFRSEDQRKWMWANKPKMARKWTEEHGSTPVKAKKGKYQEFKHPQHNITPIEHMEENVPSKERVEKLLDERKTKKETKKKLVKQGPAYVPGWRPNLSVKAKESKYIQKKKWWHSDKLKSTVSKLKEDIQFIKDAKAGKLSPSLTEKAKKKILNQSIGEREDTKTKWDLLHDKEAKGGQSFTPGWKPQLSVKTAKKGSYLTTGLKGYDVKKVSSKTSDKFMKLFKHREAGGWKEAKDYKKYLKSLKKATVNEFGLNTTKGGSKTRFPLPDVNKRTATSFSIKVGKHPAIKGKWKSLPPGMSKSLYFQDIPKGSKFLQRRMTLGSVKTLLGKTKIGKAVAAATVVAGAYEAGKRKLFTKDKKKVTKKSIGGETVVMKSGGGYIDDLL